MNYNTSTGCSALKYYFDLTSVDLSKIDKVTLAVSLTIKILPVIAAASRNPPSTFPAGVGSGRRNTRRDRHGCD